MISALHQHSCDLPLCRWARSSFLCFGFSSISSRSCSASCMGMYYAASLCSNAECGDGNYEEFDGDDSHEATPPIVVFIYMLFYCDDGVKFSARTFQLPSCFRTTASCIGFYGRVEMPERLIVVRMPPASPKPKVAEYPLCRQ